MQNPEYTHGEAYCMMAYAPKGDRPEMLSDIVIWNSRDGVTPLVAVIDGVEYRHVNWQQDLQRRNHVPHVGDYIFIDCDHAIWESQEKVKIEEWWDHPEYPVSSMYATREEALAKFMESFQPGQPMTVQVTEEIHQHFKEKARGMVISDRPVRFA